MDFRERCTTAEKCIPVSDFRVNLARLHNDMLSALNVKDMEIARLHNLLTECGNELFQCGDDGLWITDGHDGGFMRCFCDSLNEIIHGVPRSR